MKKFLVILIFSFGLSLLLPSLISYANQTNMSNYYPSPSGSYTKVRLFSPGNGGPNESNFCTETSANPPLYSNPGTPGVTFINTGTIFTDPTTGYLEICKNDGTVASYPGSCFNRFGSVNPATLPVAQQCPSNYRAVNIQNNTGFSMVAGSTVYSWSCCFTGQGNNQQASTAKSGCFSTYATALPLSNQPALCVSVDPNAYDIGCDTISVAGITPIYKRNCCFNATGSGSLNNTTCTCVSNGLCNGLCGGGAGFDNCGNACTNTNPCSCGTCNPTSQCGSPAGTCSATGAACTAIALSCSNGDTCVGGTCQCAGPLDACNYCNGSVVSCPLPGTCINDACVVNPYTCGGSEPAGATDCHNAANANGQTYTYVASCGTTPCTYTCPAGYAIGADNNCDCTKGAGGTTTSPSSIPNGTETSTYYCGTCSPNPGAGCKYTAGQAFPGICMTNTCTCNDGYTVGADGNCDCTEGASGTTTPSVPIGHGTQTSTYYCGTCSDNPGVWCNYTAGQAYPGICMTNHCTCDPGYAVGADGNCDLCPPPGACGGNFTCGGSEPSAGATDCGNAATSSGQTYSNVASCGSTPCTFVCNAGYSYNGVSCVATCGPAPANTTYCFNSPPNSPNTPSVYSSYCSVFSSNPPCTYTCAAGYTYSNGACVACTGKTFCDGTNQPAAVGTQGCGTDGEQWFCTTGGWSDAGSCTCTPGCTCDNSCHSSEYKNSCGDYECAPNCDGFCSAGTCKQRNPCTGCSGSCGGGTGVDSCGNSCTNNTPCVGGGTPGCTCTGNCNASSSADSCGITGACPATCAGSCDILGHCVDCTPNCSGLQCGPDPNCHSSCGSCPAGDYCNASGTCICTPVCYQTCSTTSYADSCGKADVCPATCPASTSSCVNGQCLANGDGTPVNIPPIPGPGGCTPGTPNWGPCEPFTACTPTCNSGCAGMQTDANGCPGSNTQACTIPATGNCPCAETGGIVGCDGVCNSGKVYDACRVCNGVLNSCSGSCTAPNGCPGTNSCSGDSCECMPDRSLSPDACGKCGGNVASCNYPNTCSGDSCVAPSCSPTCGGTQGECDEGSSLLGPVIGHPHNFTCATGPKSGQGVIDYNNYTWNCACGGGATSTGCSYQDSADYPDPCGD